MDWTNTLSYSQEHINNLISKKSLFGDQDKDCFQLIWRDITKLAKQKCKTEVHGLAILEYIKMQMIPRGLRMTSEPKIYLDNEKFTQGYEKIMNKSSLDVMILIIEISEEEAEKNKLRIEELLTEAKTKNKPEEYDKQLEQLQKILDQYRIDERENKMEKLNRDKIDYEEKRVYPWLYKPQLNTKKHKEDFGRGESHQKTVRFEDSSGTSGSVDDSLYPEIQQKKKMNSQNQSFLGRGRGRGNYRPRNRRRGSRQSGQWYQGDQYPQDNYNQGPNTRSKGYQQ